MLALVASIHVLNTASAEEDVDGRHEADHDGSVVFMGSGLGPRAAPE